MEGILHETIKYSSKVIAVIFTMATTGLTFFSFEDIGINENCHKFLILLCLLILSIIYAFLRVFFKRKLNIWKKGTGSIKVMYGDLFKIGFPNKVYVNKKPLIVIPVNTHFDTIVEELGPRALVSANTNHGRWLDKYMKVSGKTPEMIQNDIYSYLDRIGVEYINDSQREKGGKRLYKEGTCALINGPSNVSYILIAISEFNDNNNAQSTKNTIIKCVKDLVTFLDCNCQGYESYIPLMGTGMSRANLDHKQSLHTILSTCTLYNDQIHSHINIVIYNGDRSKVSIYDK